MGVQTALALGAGAFSMYSQRKNMKAQISAAQQNAAIIEQQAAINAQMATSMAAGQAHAVRQRAEFEAQSHELNAGIARNNAIMAQQDAKSSRQRMRFDVDRADRRNRMLAGSQRAAVAKAGVTIEGTPADVMFDSALQGEIEELATIYMGNQEVRKFVIEAYNSNYSAETQDYNASAARHFGGQEANFMQWQAGANASMTMHNAGMQANSIRAAIPGMRSQSYINMIGTGLSTAASAYSLLRPSSMYPQKTISTTSTPLTGGYGSADPGQLWS
jgi:hypothetical protein